jgi:hypothetical protein
MTIEDSGKNGFRLTIENRKDGIAGVVARIAIPAGPDVGRAPDEGT